MVTDDWRGLGKQFPFAMYTRVEFGVGASNRVADEAKVLAGRPLVVSDAGVVGAGIVEPLVASLEAARLVPTLFTDVEPNPRAATVDRAAEAGRAHGADMVVGVGGGSVLDSAKGAAAVITHGGTIFDYEGVDRVPGPTVPVIAIPTTAGTGSEVTAWSIVTDPARSYKMAIGGAHLSPSVALVDPRLTLTLPPEPTAMTGVDALTHAIEGYVARCSNPVGDALALYAVELIALSIERATNDGGDLEARCGMLLGSLLAGITLANTDTAAVHAMAEALGGVFDIAHGTANAVSLPHVMRYNLAAVPEKTARIGRALGLPTGSLPLEEAARATIDGVVALLERLGTPTLRELGVGEADVPKLVSIAMMNTGNPDNPVDVDENSFTALFREALGPQGAD